jgi:hypothetical protein
LECPFQTPKSQFSGLLEYSIHKRKLMEIKYEI